MRSLSDFFYKISNFYLLLFLLGLYILFVAHYLPDAEKQINALAKKEIGPIDLTIGYFPTRTLHMIKDYGDEGRIYYRNVEMTLDILYPLTYACFFIVLLSLLLRNYKSFRFRQWNIFPLATLIFDFLENAFIIRLLNLYPAEGIFTAHFVEIFKLLKWGSLVILLGILLFASYSAIKRNIFQPN